MLYFFLTVYPALLCVFFTMRDIFLLIKDRHTYYISKKKIKFKIIKNLKGRTIRRIPYHVIVRIRRRRWLPNSRVVKYRKKYLAFNTNRLYINKKPFWRWKSYKAVFFAKRGLQNAKFRPVTHKERVFHGWKKIDRTFYVASFIKKAAGTMDHFYHFLNRHRLRFFFKSKLYLNLYFARLFEYKSRRHIYQFRKYLKQKRKRLTYFLHYFLNRLDLFLWRWHGMWKLWTLRKCQLMVYYGLVLINFKKKKSYLYRLRSSDCVNVLLGGQKAFNFYWKVYRTNFLKYGKTKYRPGYPVKWRSARKQRRRRVKRMSRLHLWFRLISTRNWNTTFFKYYHYFYEISRRIRAYVYIIPTKQLDFAKNLILGKVKKQRMHRTINYFINMSFL